MRDIRPPTWLELESVIPLAAEPGVTSVAIRHDPKPRDNGANIPNMSSGFRRGERA